MRLTLESAKLNSLTPERSSVKVIMTSALFVEPVAQYSKVEPPSSVPLVNPSTSTLLITGAVASYIHELAPAVPGISIRSEVSVSVKSLILRD